MQYTSKQVNVWGNSKSLNEDIVPFKIDDIEFNRVSSAKDGEWRDDCLPMPTTIEAPQTYTVARQEVAGYKTITQATEPVALKTLHVVVTTHTKDDRDRLDALDNYKPHEIQCHLFTESPILMYIERKTPRVPRTGMQQYAIEWDITFVEVNDNNSV